MLAIAAGLFAYRGQITAFVAERVARRALPPAQTYEEASASPSVILSEQSEPKDPARMRVATPPTSVGDSSSLIAPQNDIENEALAIPSEFNLAVPFTSQAPFAVWDEMHNEACEEAAVMMVNAFYDGRTFTPQKAEDELQDIVVWENSTFGYFKDTTAEETAQILRKKYGYENVRVIYEPTLNDIKREVARGRPVIIPAAGQLLGNRYFRQPGPLYHMLVVRGWTEDGIIITNDPGTKRGEGYLYRPEILMNAVHDWNGGDVLNGRKAMIVIDNE